MTLLKIRQSGRIALFYLAFVVILIIAGYWLYRTYGDAQNARDEVLENHRKKAKTAEGFAALPYDRKGRVPAIVIDDQSGPYFRGLGTGRCLMRDDALERGLHFVSIDLGRGDLEKLIVSLLDAEANPSASASKSKRAVIRLFTANGEQRRILTKDQDRGIALVTKAVEGLKKRSIAPYRAVLSHAGPADLSSRQAQVWPLNRPSLSKILSQEVVLSTESELARLTKIRSGGLYTSKANEGKNLLNLSIRVDLVRWDTEQP